MKKVILLLVILFLAGCVEKPISAETDEHGCLSGAGYQWCEANQQCQRFWEEPCPVITLERATEVALASGCVEDGSLEQEAFYNDNTHTWWIEMDLVKEGCLPACVIDAETLTAELNWRCTTVIEPEITNFEECVEAGNPVMESYPRQCRAGEETFVEDINITMI